MKKKKKKGKKKKRERRKRKQQEEKVLQRHIPEWYKSCSENNFRMFVTRTRLVSDIEMNKILAGAGWVGWRKPHNLSLY